MTDANVSYPRGAVRRRFTTDVPPRLQYERPDESEAAFQDWLIDYAKLKRWKVYHTHRSDHSEAGFPDLVMVRTSPSGSRCVVAEIKRAGEAPSMAQVGWLLALARVPGVEAFAWAPGDRNEIERMLE